MDKKNGPLDWLKKRFDQEKDRPAGKSNKVHYMMILLLAGAALMLLGDMWSRGERGGSSPVNKEMETAAAGTQEVDGNAGMDNAMKLFEEQYENQLKQALEEIVGVHDVTVVVNVEATEKKIFEKNTTIKNQTTNEGDRDGGTRKIEDQSTEDQLVFIREGDQEVPVTIETQKPAIRGVLVVAGGADNIVVKKWIVEAVTKALDVPSHKVAVMPKKSKGDS
ncbi:MAG TPA: stage III sporulation protein AG [Bacillaceae bacterium]